MNMNKIALIGSCAVALVGINALILAQDSKAPAQQGQAPDMQLPPGMTEEDMMACMAAGQPGEMHEWLAEDVGEWSGPSKMWTAPGTEPVVSNSSSTVAPIIGGRFFECKVEGEMPGMGPFEGRCITGFDNVAGNFQVVWMDCMGTGMAIGTGELSSDKKTMTITYTYTCPMKKAPMTFREVTTRTDANHQTQQMWMPDPVTGKEFKMMEIDLTRQTKTAAAGR